MATQIHFTRNFPEVDSHRDCLTFPAVVDGKGLTVVITTEAFIKRFAPKHSQKEELERVSMLEMLSLQGLAVRFIHAGQIDTDKKELVIPANDVMRVIFKERVYQWREGEVMIRHATRYLEDAIAHPEPLLTVEWDRGQDARGDTQFLFRIFDTDTSLATYFMLWSFRSSYEIRMQMIRIWGDFLQARSHRQLDKLTASSELGGEQHGP